MGKIIDVSPVEKLTFRLADGTELRALFTVAAFAKIDTTYDGGYEKLMKDYETKPFEAMTYLIYAGFVAAGESISYKDTCELVVSMSPSALQETFLFIGEQLAKDDPELKKKIQSMRQPSLHPSLRRLIGRR